MRSFILSLSLSAGVGRRPPRLLRACCVKFVLGVKRRGVPPFPSSPEMCSLFFEAAPVELCDHSVRAQVKPLPLLQQQVRVLRLLCCSSRFRFFPRVFFFVLVLCLAFSFFFFFPRLASVSQSHPVTLLQNRNLKSNRVP